MAQQFNANKDLNKGQMSELLIDGEVYANIKSVKTEISSDSEEIYIAGKWGKETIFNGSSGSGSFVLYETFDGFDERALESFKELGYLEVTLKVRQWNPASGAERYLIIEEAKINKFSPVDIELGKISEKTYEFSFNPDSLSYE